ncbi:hypothetical protein [Kutzneria sp. NPDC052558]|uniref:hypothetical protein n=1 Tax=Kutzneria sp. NPDC052558 TaxID=3364121 RepID=UPI0037C85BDF
MTAVVAAATLATGATVGSAAAATAHPAATASVASASDGFEGDPWAHWEKGSSGEANADGNYNQGTAHTGLNNGWLYAAHGWAAERYGIAIDSWPKSNCRASIWAYPVDYDAQVELQIWDPNGWRLVGTTAPYLKKNSWQQIVTSSINLAGVNKVYVQAIYGNDTGVGQFVRIDDLAFTCS